MNHVSGSLRLRLGGIAAAALLASLALAPAAVSAATVTTYNTGQQNTTPGAIDNNYKLFAAPLGVTIGVQARVAQQQPGVWLPTAASPTSAWIEPAWRPDATGQFVAVNTPGTYVYETMFDMTGFNVATALFSGRWLVDDGLNLDILLNGVSITALGGSFTAPSNYTNWTTFNFGPAGLIANSLNALRFQVGNATSRTGLRVEYSGDAQLIPEPATLALTGSALLALGLTRTRRKLANVPA